MCSFVPQHNHSHNTLTGFAGPICEVSAVQSRETANRSKVQHLFVNSMTNRRQLQYNIPFFFFFYKVFREKNSYRPGKNAVRSKFSLFRSLMLARRLFSPPPWIGFWMHYIQRRKARVQPGQERATYFDSDLTWVSCWHSASLDEKDKDSNSGTKFPPCALVHFFCLFFLLSFVAFSAWSRVKGLLEKRQGQII